MRRIVFTVVLRKKKKTDHLIPVRKLDLELFDEKKRNLSSSGIYPSDGPKNESKIKRKEKMATLVEGVPKAPFSIATTPRCRGGRYSFLGLLYFNRDSYLIILTVNQNGLKYHFLSLRYDST